MTWIHDPVRPFFIIIENVLTLSSTFIFHLNFFPVQYADGERSCVLDGIYQIGSIKFY